MAKIDFGFDHFLKLLVVGGDEYSSRVGKSSFVRTFCEGVFPPLLNTTDLDTTDHRIRFMEIDGVRIKFQVWDLTSRKQYRFIPRMYAPGAKGAIILYDVTDESSFQLIKTWIEVLCGEDVPKMVVMIVGNKCDLEESRVVSKERGRMLAEEYGLKFMEVGAKIYHNIDKVFSTLARDILTLELISSTAVLPSASQHKLS